jgi:hypothetical protein
MLHVPRYVKKRVYRGTKSVFKKARNRHAVLLSFDRPLEPDAQARREQRISRLGLKAPERLKQLIR